MRAADNDLHFDFLSWTARRIGATPAELAAARRTVAARRAAGTGPRVTPARRPPHPATGRRRLTPGRLFPERDDRPVGGTARTAGTGRTRQKTLAFS